MLIAAVWMTATFASSISGLQLMPALVVESSLVTFFLTLSLNQSYLLVPALVIPQFVAGIHRGTRGAFESLGAEVVVLTATIGSNASIHAIDGAAGDALHLAARRPGLRAHRRRHPLGQA